MKIKAPFNENQIKNIKEYQQNSNFHPFTCLYRGSHKGEGILSPTKDGMICPECNYIQDWVHDFMTTIYYNKKTDKFNLAIIKSQFKKIIQNI